VCHQEQFERYSHSKGLPTFVGSTLRHSRCTWLLSPPWSPSTFSLHVGRVMAEHKRLSEAIEDYERHRRARNIAASIRKNEMYVLRRFAAWYGDVQVRHMTPEKVDLSV
jgi:hypothetical protein